jgi:beta-galactosidase
MRNKVLMGLFNLLPIIALMINTGCNKQNSTKMSDRDNLFNEGWKFKRDSVIGAEQPSFNDSSWLKVDLPHDYSIINLRVNDKKNQIGPFSKESPANGQPTGHMLGGNAWYRKNFTLNKSQEGKIVVLKFEGIYMESDIWVNGKKVGTHKNGYTPFWFDITSLLNKIGEPNVIAVKVENTGRNSRWYSGSGIYRNVHIIFSDPVHVGVWGAKITSSEIKAGKAIVDAEITIQNETESDVDAKVTVNIEGPNGEMAGSTTSSILVPAKSSKLTVNKVSVDNPKLWSLESPNLYKAEIEINTDNKISDIYNQTFGIRSIEFSVDKGFLLNGKPTLLKGGCVHHENGLLGAAAFDRAEERKVEILKANGYNAIRCAHNPYSQSFYDACDKLGMLVIDEFTDMWDAYKNPQDYARFFRECWNKDLTDWVTCNRNHPSIIMWSIGNEITTHSEENRVQTGKKLADRVRELDNNRAITQGVTGFFYPNGWKTTAPTFASLDVCGYNYNQQQFEKDHVEFPNRIMFTSESYPKEAYDYWKAVEKYPYVIGDFVWTAMDYIGEVGIGKSNYVPATMDLGKMGNFSGIQIPEGGSLWDLLVYAPSTWPNYLSECGDIDITGEKKPQMLYRDVIWDNSKVEINVHEPIPDGMVDYGSQWSWPKEYPHWNWQGNEGKPLQIRVFTKASNVKLELNGKIIGEKTLSENDKCIAEFVVPYQPGELKAKVSDNGKEVASKVLKTSGLPISIKLSADRSNIKADRNDLSFVKIEVVDENGKLVPLNSIKVNLILSGDGELIASGNASPSDMESFNNSEIKTYEGKALAIVRPFTANGEIKLHAESDGLKSGDIIIEVH